MKFILNTAIDPHFCAIFDKNNNLIERVVWENRKKDAEMVWSALNKCDLDKINFIGGLSGPGGFSSLRAAAGILNSLCFANNLQVRQIRSDRLVSAFLRKTDFQGTFLLNSFGGSVFLLQKTGDLEIISVENAVEKFKNEKVFVGVLPKEKQAFFKQKVDLEIKDLEMVLLEELEKTEPQKSFLPDYQFSPV